MLLKNYRHSGLKEITGRMRAAIEGTRVDVDWKGEGRNPGNAKLRMRMNVEENAGEEGAAKLATRAGALHSGAVRVPRVYRKIVDLPTGKSRMGFAPLIGARAKRGLKKGVFKTALSHRSDVWAGRKGINRTKFTDTGKSFRSGRIVVIKAHPYFYLSPDQENIVREQFTQWLVNEFAAAEVPA
jgi:hypothetical protein